MNSYRLFRFNCSTYRTPAPLGSIICSFCGECSFVYYGVPFRWMCAPIFPSPFLYFYISLSNLAPTHALSSYCLTAPIHFSFGHFHLLQLYSIPASHICPSTTLSKSDRPFPFRPSPFHMSTSANVNYVTASCLHYTSLYDKWPSDRVAVPSHPLPATHLQYTKHTYTVHISMVLAHTFRDFACVN